MREGVESLLWSSKSYVLQWQGTLARVNFDQ